jgi:WhiB family redox-sensing transcriptional regulator
MLWFFWKPVTFAGSQTSEKGDVVDWSLALCKGEDVDMFYPPEYKHLTLVERKYWRDRVGVAKALCAECPLREQCLKWAIDNGEVFGVWGGYTPRERRRLRRNQIVGPRSRAW